MTSLDGARIAIVHDWLVTPGGAELVLREMMDVFPAADLFTLIDRRLPDDRASGANLPPAEPAAGADLPPTEQVGGLKQPCTSWLQHVPGIAKHYRSFLPLMPLAVRSLDVSGYDIVLSNSHAIAKGVPVHPRQVHLCYCLSPMRYAWDLRDQYLHEAGLDGAVKGPLARFLLERMRRWDVANTSRVTAFATLSHFIANRIRRAYGRDAEVIHPPVDTDFFTPAGTGGDDGYYVTASRFVPYKRVDLIARAFALLPDRKLVIVGDGPDRAKVAAAAGANVTLAGRQPREALRTWLQGARAFLFAAEEDFGIAPVEAQACGKPVIAYGKGGVLETVRGLDDAAPTGVFFDQQTPESLADAIRRFETRSAGISATACRENAERFHPSRFREGIRGFVERNAV